MLDHSSSLVLLTMLCTALIACTLFITMAKSLLTTVIYLALYSVTICCVYLLMDAPDVAMTEAAIGTCLTTVIFLTILPKVQSEQQLQSTLSLILSAALCSSLALILCYLGYNMVDYGSHNPVHSGDSSYYLSYTKYDIDLPSFVASILASYRGFDTLGETTVIMMAGLAVLLILGSKKHNIDV